MNPIDALWQWLQEVPELAAMKQFRGVWRDQPDNAGDRLVSMVLNGGAQGTVETLYPRIRVLLMGPQGKRADAKPLGDVAWNLALRMQNDYQACGVAQIRLIGSIIGPGYTTEDRAWYELNLELTV